MNTLYIAPYRQSDDNGIISQLYLQQLLDSSRYNLSARPLYIDPSCAIEVSEQSPLLVETNTLDHYDICIQYAPINLLRPYNVFKHNIAIPIFESYKTLSNKHRQLLSGFDKIIINNNTSETMLVKSDLGSKIGRIKCPISLNTIEKQKQQKINLNIHNNTKKFYFFGHIDQDWDLIQKILISFYLAFRCEYGYSLVLCMEGANGKSQNRFYEIATNIRKAMKLI